MPKRTTRCETSDFPTFTRVRLLNDFAGFVKAPAKATRSLVKLLATATRSGTNCCDWRNTSIASSHLPSAA